MTMFETSCLCQNALGQRSRVTYLVQVLFNVCLVKVDTTGCDSGFPKKLKDNLSTHLLLCLREEYFQGSHAFILFVLCAGLLDRYITSTSLPLWYH